MKERNVMWELFSCVEHEDLTIFSKVMVTVDSLYVREGDHRREICGWQRCSVTCGN